jgi:CheY-like chemotaxis protein
MDEREGDAASLRFSVKDTGLGVKEEDMPKLFMAYERLDEEKNSSIQGTGLGLDISRRFAELMGGTLICKSTYGKGSEFVLTVRQKILDSAPVGVFLEQVVNAETGPYVPQFIAPDADVLVVDDTPVNLSVIRGLLKPTKIFVTTATSGEECLEKLKETVFNVVLLDHMMPEMDGLETVEKIREKYPDLPVYVLTDNAAQSEEYYISRGFTGRLTKPVDSLILEKTIMKHLPAEMLEKPVAEGIDKLMSVPDNMQWIYETEGIDAGEGIKNSGGINNYLFALKLFFDNIDGNIKVIRDSYGIRNLRLYTIKVHALKSSARIIGAMELSQLAGELEAAGDKEDLEFIRANTYKLLSEYEAFKEKLSRINTD